MAPGHHYHELMPPQGGSARDMSGNRYYSRETLDAMESRTLEKDEADQARLKSLRINSYVDLEEAEQIRDRQEAREDVYLQPKADELNSYFQLLGLEPLPTPLPKAITEFYRPPYNSAPINSQVEPYTTACRDGRLNVVKEWVETKLDTLRPVGLQHGLNHAVACDQVDVAQFLLTEGCAYVDGAAVELACKNLSLPMFQLFVKQGYHPNQQIPSSMGRFGTALVHCLGSVELTRFLLDSGADPNLSNWRDPRAQPWGLRGTPPMDRQSGRALDEAVKGGYLQVTELLLRHGADPAYARPIHELIKRKAADWRPFMDLLLRYGVDVNARKPNRAGPFRALHYALRFKNWDMVEFLLEHGADPYVKDSDGRRGLGDAFHVASQNARTSSAEDLDKPVADDVTRLREIVARVASMKGRSAEESDQTSYDIEKA
jgi:hypothetical protein